jgi:hypothetical protein
MAYSKKTEKNKSGYMIGCFIVVLAITYLFFNILDGWHKYQESTKRLEASISSIEDLTGQYEELKKIKALEESTTGYEMRVRSKFNMNKPDENVVFITSDEVPEEIHEDKGFKKIMNTFKNFFN